MITEYTKIVSGFQPYSYQVKVAELLLAGKNVILSVPTGAGKTWASVLPFLYAKENKLIFPQKMIYSLPLRTLTNSIHSDLTENEQVEKRFQELITKQTGEYSDDAYFEKDIIFSTIDQTLSNFLCFPLPLSKSQANINAGALIGSYLVFDEFHLLDSKLSMTTTLGMLRMMGNLSRFCIMTATMTDEFMTAIKDYVGNCEIVTLADFKDDIPKIQSLLPSINKKKIHVINGKLDAQTIINKHKNKTIVICNRVESAQQIYNDIKASKKESTILICLHSRFFDEQRKEKEQRLKELFKKGSQSDAILISTQVIEAGMDISCEVMHTEISPINSFLQRAGRCARFSGETGEIFIYDIFELSEREKISLDVENEEDEKEIQALNRKYLPYEKALCEATREEIIRYDTLDGDIPKILIEKILGKYEKDIINQIHGSNIQKRIAECWQTCEKNNYRSTVRDIQSVEVVLITDDEMRNKVEKLPFIYQSVGIFKWSLVSWLNKMQLEHEEDTLVWTLTENTIFDFDFDDEQEQKKVLQKFTDYRNLPQQVFLNAKYFGYNDEIGFNNLGYSTGTASNQKPYHKKEDNFKPLEKDTFYQHNMGLIGCFQQEFEPKLDFIAEQLRHFLQRPDLTKEDFSQLIKLMIALHDYGKLNNSWQKPMRTYQALKENRPLNEFKEVLAHTDFDRTSDYDIELTKQAKLSTRPPHAGVGAYVGEFIIEDNFFMNPICAAIAKHHKAVLNENKCPKFEISDSNSSAMSKLLNDLGLDITLENEGSEETLTHILGLSEPRQIMYLFLVRILRLCDQKATENLKKYYNE
jgi:CRISPR-associated endonuclease/helicase Cas3